MHQIAISKKVVLGAMGAVFLGFSLAAAAFASIPSLHGVISGCRSNLSGQLYVVDSSANCEVGQTSVKWDRGLLGYAYQPQDDLNDIQIAYTKGSMPFVVTKIMVNGNMHQCVDMPTDIAVAARFTTVNGIANDLLLRDKGVTSSDLNDACGPSYEGMLNSQVVSPESTVLIY